MNLIPNLKVVDQLINIMTTADINQNFNCTYWQRSRDFTNHVIYYNYADFVKNKSVGSFGGHVALSSYWKSFGGVINRDGSPSYNQLTPIQSLAAWLQVDNIIADFLLHNTITYYNNQDNSNHCVFNKWWFDVTPVDYINLLNEVKQQKSFRFVCNNALLYDLQPNIKAKIISLIS